MSWLAGGLIVFAVFLHIGVLTSIGESLKVLAAELQAIRRLYEPDDPA